MIALYAKNNALLIHDGRSGEADVAQGTDGIEQYIVCRFGAGDISQQQDGGQGQTKINREPDERDGE